MVTAYMATLSPAERAVERVERERAAERAERAAERAERERAAERAERAAERDARERQAIDALPEGVERTRAHDRYMANAASKGSCRPPSRCPLLALSLLKHLLQTGGNFVSTEVTLGMPLLVAMMWFKATLLRRSLFSAAFLILSLGLSHCERVWIPLLIAIGEC